MSGSCYSCATGFSLFKKEHGCKNCGYSFCKECMKSSKIAVPKHKNEKHKVCVKCYNILSGKIKPPGPVQQSPPAALKKRLDALENPSAVKPLPVGDVKPRSSGMAKFQGMDKQDIDIAQRLQALKEKKDVKPVPSHKEMEERLKKLKDDLPPPPSEDEMTARLAALKGQDPQSVNKPHVFKTDSRCQQQQVDDLLQEICDEVEIDSHGINHAEDVQNRLDQFRGQNNTAENNLNTDQSGPAKTFVKNVPTFDENFKSASGEEVNWSDMQRLVAEVADELELDSRRAVAGLQKDKELWERLQTLKKKEQKEEKIINKDENNASSSQDDSSSKSSAQPDSVTSNSQSGASISQAENEQDSGSENDEEAAKELIRQLLIENEIDANVSVGDTKNQKKFSMRDYKVEEDPDAADYEVDPDEFPWCIICNEDASVRCLGCDGDLYCKSCYRQGHDRFERDEHETRTFMPKKTKS